MSSDLDIDQLIGGCARLVVAIWLPDAVVNVRVVQCGRVVGD